MTPDKKPKIRQKSKKIKALNPKAGKVLAKAKKTPLWSKFDFIEEKTDKFWDKKAYKQCLWQYFIKVKQGNEMTKSDYAVVWLTFNEIGSNAEEQFKTQEEKADEKINPNIDYVKKLEAGLEHRGFMTPEEKEKFVKKTTRMAYPPSQYEAQKIIALILKKEINNKNVKNNPRPS